MTRLLRAQSVIISCPICGKMCHRCIKPVAALATIQMMCPGTLVFFKTKFRILGIHIRILGVHPFARDSNKSGVGKDGKNADI